MSKNALLTVNINNVMRPNQRASFQAAAARWNAEYIEITELSGGMHAYGMKLLAFELCDADRIFYVDASDAIISIDCPNPFVMFPEDAFVAVRNNQPHMPGVSYRACVDTYQQDLLILGERYGWVPGSPELFVNSGVWCASRKHHADLLAKAAALSINHYGVTAWCDQSELNYILHQTKTPVWLAADTWNYQFPPDTEDRPMAAYVYHYTGGENRDRIEGIGWNKAALKWRVTEQKPKLLWIGDAGCDTGFARVTHNVCDYLATYWDVHVLGINYMGGPHDHPYRIYPSRTRGDLWGLNWFTELLEEIQPDAVCAIQDPWIVSRFATEFDRGHIPMAAYMPVDARNQPPSACNGLNKLDLAIFYTRFGETQCRLAGFKGRSEIIPHGVNRDIYRPLEKSVARSELLLDKLGDDLFIVGNVNRNQPRKRLDLTVQYFAEWLRRDAGCVHKIENAYLYLHCSQRDTMGLALAQLASYYGVARRLIIPDEAIVTPERGLPESAMAHVYNSFDVQVSTATGEGWGLTQMEGAACGVPQIVPHSSALAEWLAGAAYLVPCSANEANPGINTVGAIPDKDAWIFALDRMYHDHELRRRYAQKALDLTGQPRFTWANIGETFHRRLTEMVERKYAEISSQTEQTERAA